MKVAQIAKVREKIVSDDKEFENIEDAIEASEETEFYEEEDSEEDKIYKGDEEDSSEEDDEE